MSRVRKRRKKRAAHNFTADIEALTRLATFSVADRDALLPSVVLPREIKRGSVTLVEEIGAGHFSNVWKASFEAEGKKPKSAANQFSYLGVIRLDVISSFDLLRARF